MAIVSITQDRQDIGQAIEAALRHLDLEPLVRGELVAVKPNETWATEQDTTAVTQGDTLRAVLRAVKRHQLKLHRTATVTMALKNIAMSFPAADHYGHPRSKEEHQHAFFDDMHSFIAAMAKRFPIHLAITVGHPAMIATGPTGGIAVETGLAIASTDAVAADCVGARLLGFTSQAVRHLWEAGRLGLGETDTSRMEYPGLSLDDAARAFTQAAYGKAITLRGA
jgi:uncharacterized protein (DUF362 family)